MVGASDVEGGYLDPAPRISRLLQRQGREDPKQSRILPASVVVNDSDVTISSLARKAIHFFVCDGSTAALG